MGKKFYKNKACKYHASLEISNDGKRWTNIPTTTHPNRLRNYIKLNDPISKNQKKGSNTFIQKRIRDDPVCKRGKKVNYQLSKRDERLVDDVILKNKKH
jgi:hypothetical protein